jgi:hypothetical protein
MDGSFPMRRYTLNLDSWFESHEVLKISAKLWVSYQSLPMQQNLPKTAQNCQNSLKSAQRQNFEIPPKIENLVFSKIKICTCRGDTSACFHRSDLQSKNFLYVFFIVKERPLYVNFSIPPCGK